MKCGQVTYKPDDGGMTRHVCENDAEFKLNGELSDLCCESCLVAIIRQQAPVPLTVQALP